MAEVGSSETKVSNYESIRRHIPHDRSFHDIPKIAVFCTDWRHAGNDIYQ